MFYRDFRNCLLHYLAHVCQYTSFNWLHYCLYLLVKLTLKLSVHTCPLRVKPCSRLGIPIILISVYNVAGKNCSEKFTILSISIWSLPYSQLTSPLPLEFNWLLQIRYIMGEQVADLIYFLDSTLLAMNFLDLTFVLCNGDGICNTAEYIERRILQSVFGKTIAVAK